MLDDLETLERKVFRTNWDDGLLDLFAAWGVILVGVAWWRDLPVMGAIVPALLVPIWGPARAKLIEPRLGRVEFGAAREKSNRRWLQASFLSGVLVLAAAIAIYLGRDHETAHNVGHLVAALPAALLAVMAMMVAVMVSCSRFVGHAAILLMAAFVGVALQWHPGNILMLAGGLMLLAAIFTLLRFLGENPVATDTVE